MTSSLAPVTSLSRANKRPREDDEHGIEAAAPPPRRPRLDSSTPFLQNDVKSSVQPIPISKPSVPRQSTPFPTQSRHPAPTSITSPSVVPSHAASTTTPLCVARQSDDVEHKYLHNPSRITSRPRRQSSPDSTLRFSPSRPGGLFRRTLLNELIRSMYLRLELGLVTEPECPLHGSLKTAWDHLKTTVERDQEEAEEYNFEDEDMDDEEWEGGDDWMGDKCV